MRKSLIAVSVIGLMLALSSSSWAVTYVSVDPSLICAFFTKRESRRDLSETRGHVTYCANSKGWITGAVLSKTGKIRCEIKGFMNPHTGCGSFTWCDEYYDIPCMK